MEAGSSALGGLTPCSGTQCALAHFPRIFPERGAAGARQDGDVMPQFTSPSRITARRSGPMRPPVTL